MCAATALARVQVSETTITLPTWSEGAPDTNPQFDAFANSGIYGGGYASYPYSLRTNFLTGSSDQTWRLLVLENEYLQCRVFPDLGGHLYSCLDKINGREMFYANPVIRKAWVGLRGAWVAMGIELNFPVGHSLVTATPISYEMTQNSDGSGSVWVADVDRKTGLEFRVEYRLQPLSTVLIQNVNLYNRTDVRQPYYFWSNAEVKMEDMTNLSDMFLYPTNLVASHGLTFVDTWPVSTTGVDYSVERNFTDGLGLFAYRTNEPFMAIYHPTTKTGTVHFADVTAVPGKKLWAWGSGEIGDTWVQANLTSNFNSYMETQGGVVENQETHIFLDPQQSSHFTEYWMPARELDGVTRANLNAVLFFGRDSTGSLNMELNANSMFPNAAIQILDGANVIYSDAANLTPTSTYRYTFSNPSTSTQYTLKISDSAGNVLISHTEGQYDALTASSVTLGPQPQVDINQSDTDQQVLYRADVNERLQAYYFAESDYRIGLSKFPRSLPLLKASGRMSVAAGRFSDGQSQLLQYLAVTPNDNEAHYYLGLAYSGLGQLEAAAKEWTGVQNSTDFGRPATFELACLRALTGDLTSAALLFAAVNASSQDAVRAAGLEIAVLRHQSQTESANAKLAQWRAIAPTDLFLRYEQTLAGSSDDALWSALGAEPERVLNLADDYLRLGFFADAATLLARAEPDVPAQQREPGSTLPQNNALVAYHRGYSNILAGGSGASDFAAASAMPLAYVSPSRQSSFPALRLAIQTNNSDATAHFLLGMLFMGQRQVDEAISEWQMARSLRKDLPTLHRNLGRALLDLKNDPAGALAVLSEGLTYDSANPDLQNAYQRALAAMPADSN